MQPVYEQLSAALGEVEAFGTKKGMTAKKLAKAGVTTISGLLERTDSQKDITMLAEQTGISADLLKEWKTKADLTRIKGVGAEYQHLLQAALLVEAARSGRLLSRWTSRSTVPSPRPGRAQTRRRVRQRRSAVGSESY